MTKPFMLDDEQVRAGMAHLARVDPRIAEALELYGHPPLRRAEQGFAALLRAIVGQQVSVYAARSIWDRLAAAIVPMEPATILATSEERLRACGLSGNKAKFARSLARNVIDGAIDFASLDALDDDAVIAMLTTAKGIGRWTAEIYLMFALGRADVMPGNDIGLIVAAQHLLRLDDRPDPKSMLELAEPWRPWRTVAALFLWHYRHNMPDFSDSPVARQKRDDDRAAKEARATARAAKPASPKAESKRKAGAKRKVAAKAKAKVAKNAAPKRKTATTRATAKVKRATTTRAKTAIKRGS